jgi:putative transposase
MVSTSQGDLLGQGFHARLLAYDARLQPLAKALARQGIKLRDSRRYRDLVQDIRGFITNETNRVMNTLVARSEVARVVVEKLDFRGAGLSKRMRRILGNCGRSVIEKKLAAVSEESGIQIVHVNPAYTSQECVGCGYVHQTNRNGACFRCGFCGKTCHADVGASRTVLERFQQGHSWAHLPRRKVLAFLDERFHTRWGVTFAGVRERPRSILAQESASVVPPHLGWAAQKPRRTLPRSTIKT